MSWSRHLLALLCLLMPTLTSAQGGPATKAPSGFTIRLDAPEAPEETPAVSAAEKAASAPTGKTLAPKKSKKPRKTAKQRRAEKRKAKAAKRKARRAAKRKARRDAARRAKREKAAKKREAKARRVAKAKARKARRAAKKQSLRKKKKVSKKSRKRVKLRKPKRRKSHRTSKRSRKKAPTITPFLNGVGSNYGRRTPYGRVETVEPGTAARIREMINGDKRTYEQPVTFEPFRARLTPDMAGMLAALSDYIKSSKDIMLVMIEGHATDHDKPVQDHALSEARASAVREFLVQRGVDANRTIAFGLGSKLPASATQDGNRRVQLHLVSGTAVVRAPARAWDQLAVAHLSGAQQLATKSTADQEWSPIKTRTQLGAPAWIQTGPTTNAVLRAPDASQLQMGTSTSVQLTKAQFRALSSAIEMTLHQGELRMINDPADSGKGTTVLGIAGAKVTAKSADLVTHAVDGQRGWIGVSRGVAMVTLSTGASFKIGAGQTIHLEGQQPSIWAQLKAPVIMGPTHGEFVKIPTLSWQPVPGAIAYRIDISRDVDFHDIVSQDSVTSTTFEIDEAAEPGKTFYWRVAAIDERSSPGRLSQRFRIGKTMPKKTNITQTETQD